MASNHTATRMDDHPCPNCGEEIELASADFDRIPWISVPGRRRGFFYTHTCGADLLLDGEGGYGDDGSRWGWWVVAQEGGAS